MVARRVLGVSVRVQVVRVQVVRAVEREHRVGRRALAVPTPLVIDPLPLVLLHTANQQPPLAVPPAVVPPPTIHGAIGGRHRAAALARVALPLAHVNRTAR